MNQRKKSADRDSPGFILSPDKKAQVQVTFNWIYILIAGVVILLFFAGIIIKQKSASEQGLQQDVIQSLESILVGASSAEKTKNFVGTSSLSSYVLEFDCQDGVSTFGIESGEQVETRLQPIFAPKEIKSNQLILWSLPYNLPYKIIDLLIISSVNTKYYVLGEGPLKDELENAVGFDPGDKAEFNFGFILDENEIDVGNNYQIRIIDLTGSAIKGNNLVPSKLQKLGDSKVTAVTISTSGKTANYFRKNGQNWKLAGSTPIISLGTEKDYALYAALFAGDAENYRCNMIKAFRRMKYLNQIYQDKIDALKRYYSAETAPDCGLILNQLPSREVVDGTIQSCLLDYQGCPSIINIANTFKELNNRLISNPTKNCLTIY